MAEIKSPIAGTLEAAKTNSIIEAFSNNLKNSEERTNSALSSQNSALVTISEGLGTINSSVQSLGASLQNISTQITNESFLEKQRLLQDQEQERILAEQELREGKESAIEKKIQDSLIKPVEKISYEATNTFSSLSRTLLFLLGGWLLSKDVNILGKAANTVKGLLENIKDISLSKLASIAGVFGLATLGIGKLINGVKSLTGKVLTSAFGGLFAGPFKAIAERLGLAPKAKPTGGVGGMRLGGNILTGGALTALDLLSGNENDPFRAVAGAAGGMVGSAGAFALGSLIPIPGTGVISGIAAYQPSADLAKSGYDEYIKPFLVGAGLVKPENSTQQEQNPPQQTNQNQRQPNETQPIPPIIPNPEVSNPNIFDSLQNSSSTSGAGTSIIGSPNQQFKIPTLEEITSSFTGMAAGLLSSIGTERDLLNREFGSLVGTGITAIGQNTNTILQPTITPGSINQDNYAQMSTDQLKKMLRTDQTPSKEEFAAATAARQEGTAQGLSGEALERKVLIATIEASKGAQTISPVPQAQIVSPTPQQLPNRVGAVGPLPEVPTNVIVAPQNQPTADVSPSRGPVNDVPAIPTGNPDNFYLLYSQVQYNIVNVV